MTDNITQVTIPEVVVERAASAGLEIHAHEGFFGLDQVKFLVYGESGVGKTVFSSTWKNAVFLDANRGMSSVTRRVSVISINDWNDLQNAVKFLANSNHGFETVVVDSLNDVQYLCMKHIIHAFPSIRRAYENLASQSDYGKMLDEFEKWVRETIALSMNVVFTCNVAPQVYETDTVQPQLVGKHTARNLAGMMDIIGYLTKREAAEGGEQKKDRLMWFDAVQYVTKDRSGLLPNQMVNPTHKKLYAYWEKQFDQSDGE